MNGKSFSDLKNLISEILVAQIEPIGKKINELLSQLNLRLISLNREHIKVFNENVIIHIRGGDFLKFKNLNP